MENFAQNYVKLDIFGIFLFKKGVNPKSLVAALPPALLSCAGCPVECVADRAQEGTCTILLPNYSPTMVGGVHHRERPPPDGAARRPLHRRDQLQQAQEVLRQARHNRDRAMVT